MHHDACPRRRHLILCKLRSCRNPWRPHRPRPVVVAAAAFSTQEVNAVADLPRWHCGAMGMLFRSVSSPPPQCRPPTLARRAMTTRGSAAPPPPTLSYTNARLVFPAEILRIPVFSVPVVLFSQESQFLFHRNFFRTPSEILSVWGLSR